MDSEKILEVFGNEINEEEAEDGYGMTIPNKTYWYCYLCDEANKTPELIVHTTTCLVGRGVKLLAEVEMLKAQNAALVKASNELLSALYASRSRFNGVVNAMFEATPHLIEAMRALVDIAKDATP